MKKFIRRLGVIALTLMLGAASASAQGWTASDVGTGDYYLYNVAAKAYLTNGSSWGTHAALDNEGILLNIAKVRDGVYTIGTNSKYSGKYFTDNGYVDTGNSTEWTFEVVSGQVNTYKLKTPGGSYAYSTFGKYNVEIGNDTGDEKSYWKLVKSSDRTDYSVATPSNPLDLSFLLNNARFELGKTGWTGEYAHGGNGSGSNGDVSSYDNRNYCAERWHNTTNVYQTITVPNGKYTISCQGFYAADDGSTHPSYLYANNDQIALDLRESDGQPYVDNMTGAANAFSNNNYNNDLLVTVTNGSLTIGIKTEDNYNWTIFDNFQVYMVDPYISVISETLPTTAITANKWYAVTIPTSDDYDITSVAGTTMTYTQNGTQLVSTATTTNTQFTAGETKTIHLEAGVLYLKSSAASTISVSYKYNVGTATSSHTYVQGGEAVTITFDASTNDPGATFSKNGNPNITFGGNAVEVTPTSNGFTFTVPAVTAGTDYTLSIPANAFGYAAGSTYNAAQNITIKAPALFDGTYFFKTDADKFWLRGEPYGSAVQVYDWGLPVKVTTDATATTLQFADASDWKIFSDGTGIYADNASPANGTWHIILTNGKYKFQNAVNNHYMKVDGTRILSTATEGEATAFTMVTPSDHQNVLTAYVNAQASAAATAAGLSASTPADLQTAANGINATTVIAGGNPTTTAEKWQGGQWDSRTVYSNTVNVTTPGLYKFTIQGFYRMTDNEATYALHTAGADCPPVYVFFGDAKTPIKSMMDDSRATAYTGNNNDYANGGNHYPNQQASSLVAFQEGRYVNTVWAYISEAGEYTYGIQYLGWAGSHSEWTCYTTESVSLTLYSQDWWGPLQAALTTYAPYNDIAAANDATGYTTAYNTYAAYTQSTPQSDMLAAINYMQNNYATYQWAHASITHPVDVTEGIILNSECGASDDNWLGSGRTHATGTYYDGSSRTYFTQNHEDGAARSQSVTIPEIGAYLLRTIVRPVYAASYATISIGTESTTTRGIQTGSSNIGNGWAYNDVFFATTSADESKTISIALSNVNVNREADCGEMHLYYIGQNADFVKDGVHRYIGTFSTATTLTPTDAAPIVDVTAATFTTAPTVNRNSNPNGLVYATANQTNVNAGTNVVKGTSCNSLELADGHPFVNSKEFTASSASYTLLAVADDGTGNKFATLVLPFNATTLAGTAYALNQGVSIATEEIRGTEVSTITANQPVLVRAAGTYSGSNVEIPVVNAGATFTNGELVGTFSPLAAPVGSYVLQSHSSRVAFYLVGDTRPTVNPFRAYIRPQAAAANKFSILFDDNEVTAIDAVDADFGTYVEIFTANGTRIHALRRGLNIVKMSDGTVRKVMVK